MTTFIALLRAVNVGGRKVPMADLRKLVVGLGCENVQSYLASGNLVFSFHGAPKAVASQLQQAIEDHFKLEVPVVLRTATQWARYAPGNPFQPAAAATPNGVLMALSQRPPARDALIKLQERAANGERVEQAGDAIWFHYPNGVAKSKLTPAFIDKVVGSPTTGRNWNTVQALDRLARQHAD